MAILVQSHEVRYELLQTTTSLGLHDWCMLANLGSSRRRSTINSNRDEKDCWMRLVHSNISKCDPMCIGCAKQYQPPNQPTNQPTNRMKLAKDNHAYLNRNLEESRIQQACSPLGNSLSARIPGIMRKLQAFRAGDTSELHTIPREP